MPKVTYTEEYQATQETIDQFHKACQLSEHYGWAYEAGWWQSTVCRLLMQLSRQQRQRELDQLKEQIRTMEIKQIVRTLS